MHGQGQAPDSYLIPSYVVARAGEMDSLISEKGIPLPGGRKWGVMGQSYFIMAFLCKPFLCLTPFVSNILAFTVGFLISLLFPVSCSYLSL